MSVIWYVTIFLKKIVDGLFDLLKTCLQVFEKKLKMKQHVKLVHLLEEPRRPLLGCPQCGKVFSKPVV